LQDVTSGPVNLVETGYRAGGNMIAMMRAGRRPRLTATGMNAVAVSVVAAGVAASLVTGLGLVAVRSLSGSPDAGPSASAPVRLTVWRHDGQPTEQKLFTDQIRRFERSHPGILVSVRQVPEADYPDQVQLGAVRSELPDVLDVDGPMLANYVYQGQLAPLDGLLAPATRADLTASIHRQGTVKGHLYGVGAIDSGLGLFASRQALRAVNARIPHGWSDAWSTDEFETILRRLATHDPDGRVLDLDLDYDVGEWYTYAFAPVIWSAGATFGRPPAFSQARQTLPTPSATAALAQLGRWVARYVDPQGDTGAALTSRRVALSWAGHWRYRGYRAALGNDLVVLPLPNFGHSAKATCGSWVWAVSRKSQHPQQAAALLDFLLSTPEVLAASDASGGPPGTLSAVQNSIAYRLDGPLATLMEALTHVCGTADEPGCIAVVRPATPAYPVITNAFQEALRTVFSGGDAAQALTEAANVVDQDAESNDWYGLEGD
jgi:multiple sugar transport system substrate-binding protein